jgi:hypothetical protein
MDAQENKAMYIWRAIIIQEALEIDSGKIE